MRKRARTRIRATFLALVVSGVAVVTTACLPPPPPPPSICGATAPTTTTTTAGGSTASDKYVAVVKKGEKTQVYTRHVRSDADIAKFKSDAEQQGQVLAFAPDGEVQALDQTPTWGFTDANFSAAWTEPTATTGAGVRVAVLDTGVLASHPDLTGHFDPTPGADFVAATDFSNPPLGVTTDPNGHGTHVSGIIAATDNTIGVVGGAPDVTLVPVRVLNAQGSGSYSAVAAGILWAADTSKGNASVISMSLGGGNDGDVVGAAIRAVEDPSNPQYTHPVVTIAAGNSACHAPGYPAIYASQNPYEPPVVLPDGNSCGSEGTCPGFPQVLSVSAVCKPDTNTQYCSYPDLWPSDPWHLATFSSLAWSGNGNPTGVAAPGVQINSTWPNGDDNINADYTELSGTSMATPFVAAVAALVQAHCSSDTASDVVARLENSAHDLGPTGVDKLFGYGMLDADAAVQAC